MAVNLANYYAEQGAEVAIAVFRPVGPYKNMVCSKVRIVGAKASRTRYWPMELVKFFRKNKFDIILSVIRSSNVCVGLASVFSPKSFLIFREANTMHSINIEPNVFFRGFMKTTMFLTYKIADKVIANSYDTQHDLIRNCFLSKKNMTVISNPVLPSNIQELTEEQTQHPWLSKHKTILAVGRLHQQKNHTMLISAFAMAKQKLEDIKLIILGEGEEKENLVNYVESKGIQDSVDFLEFQNNPYPFYRSADLFVHTARWEGFGNVLVEAMACGMPIVATDCPGGPKEILDNGKYGDLIEIDDVQGLSEAMVHNLLHPDLSRIEAAKERALDFSIERIAAKYIEPYTLPPGHPNKRHVLEEVGS